MAENQAIDRNLLADQLEEKYTLDPSKARLLSAYIRESAVTPDGDGWGLFYQGQRLSQISSLGSVRYFDLNGRWILTVDPFGNAIYQLLWDKNDQFERTVFWNVDRDLFANMYQDPAKIVGLDFKWFDQRWQGLHYAVKTDSGIYADAQHEFISPNWDDFPNRPTSPFQIDLNLKGFVLEKGNEKYEQYRMAEERANQRGLGLIEPEHLRETYRDAAQLKERYSDRIASFVQEYRTAGARMAPKKTTNGDSPVLKEINPWGTVPAGPTGARLATAEADACFNSFVTGLDRNSLLNDESLIALEFLEGEPASILRFKKVGAQVEVYVGNDTQPFRIVNTRIVRKDGRETEGIAVSDMISLVKEMNSRYNLELQKDQINHPINAVLHLDGLLGLAPQLQENLLSNLLAEFVSRSSTNTHVKFAGDKSLRELAARIIRERGLAKRNNPSLFLGEDQEFPDKMPSEAHLVFQKDLLKNKAAILQNYPNARFITLSDVQANPGDMKANVFTFSPVVSLLEQVGILDELSTASIDKAHELYQSRTGYPISREQFLLLLAGNEAMARQFPYLPLRAIDINNAIRVYFIGARMAEQAA